VEGLGGGAQVCRPAYPLSVYGVLVQRSVVMPGGYRQHFSGGILRQTLKAILARCHGDRSAAIEYCDTMTTTYPRLAAEYREYLEILKGDLYV
jgi:hypothetical protein